jgi:hypothetical protein
MCPKVPATDQPSLGLTDRKWANALAEGAVGAVDEDVMVCVVVIVVCRGCVCDKIMVISHEGDMERGKQFEWGTKSGQARG